VWQRVLGVACVLCAVQNETRLRGGVAACFGVGCVLCAVQKETRLCGGVAACLGSGVCVVFCAE
jgi:hypothetical protein